MECKQVINNLYEARDALLDIEMECVEVNKDNIWREALDRISQLIDAQHQNN